MLDIIKKHELEIDIQKIEKFNYAEPGEEEMKIIENYATPSLSYISGSARGLSWKDVDFQTLDYIINRCYKCKSIEKYHAMIVSLYKFYQHTKDKDDTEIMKSRFVASLEEAEEKRKDFKYLDKYSEEGSELFYVVEINIGVNKIIKYGISADKLRKRFALLKKNIKDTYTKQYVEITLLMIIRCDDNKAFEEEVKIAINELGLDVSGYGFKGHTETLKLQHKEELINEVVLPLVLEMNAEILYPEPEVEEIPVQTYNNDNVSQYSDGEIDLAAML